MSYLCYVLPTFSYKLKFTLFMKSIFITLFRQESKRVALPLWAKQWIKRCLITSFRCQRKRSHPHPFQLASQPFPIRSIASPPHIPIMATSIQLRLLTSTSARYWPAMATCRGPRIDRRTSHLHFIRRRAPAFQRNNSHSQRFCRARGSQTVRFRHTIFRCMREQTTN